MEKEAAVSDWIEVRKDLNSGQFTDDLRQVFETHGVDFPQNAPVSLRGKNRRWFVTIGEQEYPIRKEADKLYLLGDKANIFENRSAEPVLLGSEGDTHFELDTKEKLLS